MPERPGHGQNAKHEVNENGNAGEDQGESDPRNPRTFERLYLSYAPRLYAYVAYRVGAV
jgi:hypothetical protein